MRMITILRFLINRSCLIKRNDLIRDLNLSKEYSEVLASRLKDKNLFDKDTNVTVYQNRGTEFILLLYQTLELVYCSVIKQVLLMLGVNKYNRSSWRLFSDSSKHSLKYVLLYNTNKYASIPFWHSISLKEKCDGIDQIHDHNWVICVDLKMVNFRLVQQSAYTKFPCFLCLWDSRAKDQHYVKKEPGGKNVMANPLVPRGKIIFPPQHIKLVVNEIVCQSTQ